MGELKDSGLVKLKVLLIANRGEIAVRLIRTAKLLNVKTIAIYTRADATSLHVADADEAVRLEGSDTSAYLDGAQIIKVAKSRNADAIVPGYGFLSENTVFAKEVKEAGLLFVGPGPKAIEDFGSKHTARKLAILAKAPVVPGIDGLLQSEDHAVAEAARLGYPVMLKATAGGGGMGISICNSEQETRTAFPAVRSRAKALFKNDGMFLEKYYPKAHHVEIQVFGNGMGKAIHFGERECSIQRRYQKVVEECPSPFVEKHPQLREKMCTAAVSIAESIKYGSAGTIEYLVDDETAEFYFLEMNTRLQVEHGITEMVYSADLVELMLRQADAEMQGNGGLDAAYLDRIQSSITKNGNAIEVRVYAENPVRNFAPCPGLLQEVSWNTKGNARVDTWIRRGTVVTANYDPLLAKVMVHDESRQKAIEALQYTLKQSKVFGPPNNIGFLASITADKTFCEGHTLTNFLNSFQYHPHAVDVISGGAYTLIEDWPGRPTIGRGFGHSGPMDSVSLRLANLLVGNKEGEACLEVTLSGPELKFMGAAVVALCGAQMEFHIDGKPMEMWKSITMQAGQRLKIGKNVDGGCRAYLAIKGGLPEVATWFGSKSTAPTTTVGGYQGRALTAGDLLTLPDVDVSSNEISLPPALVPEYPSEWNLRCMSGPYEEGYLSDEFIEQFYNTTWEVSHNAARNGIRLIGPRPRFARADGGDGGSHPSNVIEYGYSIGSINWTGDDPCLFPVDGPDLGGFISSTTVIKADWWRMGQMKAGDKVKFHRVSYEEATAARNKVEENMHQLASDLSSRSNLSAVPPTGLWKTKAETTLDSQKNQKAVFHQISETGTSPLVSYRQGGDSFLTIDYGHGSLNLNYRCRAVFLYRKLQEANGAISFANGSLLAAMPCGNSLTIHYDSLKVERPALLELLTSLEATLGDISKSRFMGRKFRLPITFGSSIEKDSLQRYMDTKRPYASYLPDPMDFMAKNNGFTNEQLRDIFTKSSLMVIAVGFFVALPIALPIDPRQRIVSPKMNPSRIHTPEGQVGWGGSCMGLYNIESPGGFMNTGLSIPTVDVLGFKHGFSEEKPWLFDDFDQITFYEVSEVEYEKAMGAFRSGNYKFEYEDVVFDLEEHNKLLIDTAKEAADMKKKQMAAQADMDKLEAELLERWTKEKESTQVSMDTVEELLQDPSIIPFEAPVNSNVWKIQVEEGSKISTDQVLVILEAMKLEITVPAHEGVAGTTIEKILVKSGDVVQAGKPLMLLRKSSE